MITRRTFSQLAILSASAAALRGGRSAFAYSKPDSKFNGVQIGAIVPYSYHDVADTSAPALLQLLVHDGISGIELMNSTPEAFAGAPESPLTPGLSAGRPYVRQDVQSPRPAPTPEQKAKQAEYSAAMTKWRTSVPMSKFEELRSMYNKAGVNIYAFKLGLTMDMPDAEFDYAFRVTKALGASHFTTELPGDPALSDRIGKYAAKYKTLACYHYHLLASPTAWDGALAQSPYNGINIDIGHYVAAGNTDVLDFIQKHHDRIGSIHIKDRKSKLNGSANMPWGQGDTPIKEVLRLMQREHYKFPASIELEYTPPEGSNCEKELVKCVAYCREALG